MAKLIRLPRDFQKEGKASAAANNDKIDTESDKETKNW